MITHQRTTASLSAVVAQASPSSFRSADDRIRLLLESNDAPPHLRVDGDAVSYLVSLLSSPDDGPNDEADVAAVLDPFFSDEEEKSSRSSASALAGRIWEIVEEVKADGGDCDRGGATIGRREVGDETNPPQKQRLRFLDGTGIDDSDDAEAEAEPPSKIEADTKVSEKMFKSKAEAKRRKREEKKAAREKKRAQRKSKDSSPPPPSAEAKTVEEKSMAEMDELDDHSSAWSDLRKEGKSWGGRGAGGRGVSRTGNTAANIHLCGVSLQFAGNDLLQNATIQITRGRRYGMIGRNGVGKSTLLRRLANSSVPGMPPDMRIVLVKQQVEGSGGSAQEALLSADEERTDLLEEQRRLEEEIDQAVGGGVDSGAKHDLDEVVERLGAVSTELEAIDADGAEDRARAILRGLQFSEAMIDGPTSNLSGGWRMRVALARALFVPSDLLLLDEPTNHLDLQALLWLRGHLSKAEGAVIIVSHDRSFLDGVCTDIINFEHGKLKYHIGNYSEYERQRREAASRQAQILDASERQRAKAVSFVERQQKATADPKKQRQAKMIREKKLDRIGNYREDGKRYKTKSLKKMSEEYLRTAQKVVIEADEPVVKFRFENPTWPPGVTAGSPLVKLEGLGFSYGGGKKKGDLLLQDVTLDLNRGSKVSVVGRNGAGKSTLMKIICGELSPADTSHVFKGELWRHPTLRIGHVTQHNVEELDDFASLTVLQYAEKVLLSGDACSDATRKAAGNVRQYLGGFGLGGRHATRPVGTLSGGERMRLCFCTVLAERPHLLMLDEPTNHCDMETLDALAAALKTFQGAVVVISHNQGFLSGFCDELWVVENGHVDVRHSDTQSFEEIFFQYQSEVMVGAEKRSNMREVRSRMAKKASKQRAGAAEGTGFIG